MKLKEKKMFPAEYLMVLALWLSVSPNFHFEAYGDASGDVIPSPTACVNCSKCEFPCQQLSPPLSGDPSYGAPPPPPSGDPSYGAPPPPPPSPTPSGYSIYDAPPPPHKSGQSKCPPAPGVECCTPSAPYTYGPPNPYAPPYPYAPPNLYGPPNPYTYVPYGEGKGSASRLLPILVPLMMLFSSFIFLF